MSGVTIERLQSPEALGTTLADLAESLRVTDYSELLENFQKLLANDESELFEAQKDSNGSPWVQLRQSTINRKGHARILVDSGALMESLVSIGGSGNVHSVTPNELLFGTGIAYASFHQEGTACMPARPPVGIKGETLDKLAEAVADHAVENLKQGPQ